MSVNSKNLHYEKQEPAFLRRMRAGQAGLDGRHNVQIARPKKDRLKTDDDDDDPVIVDDDGEVIEKQAWEERLKKDLDGEEPLTSAMSDNHTIQEASKAGQTALDDQREQQQQKVVELGAPRKRKQIKVIGGGGEEDIEDVSVTKIVPGQMKHTSTQDQSSSTGTRNGERNITKKKAKKIKLSFDEPE